MHGLVFSISDTSPALWICTMIFDNPERAQQVRKSVAVRYLRMVGHISAMTRGGSHETRACNSHPCEGMGRVQPEQSGGKRWEAGRETESNAAEWRRGKPLIPKDTKAICPMGVSQSLAPMKTRLPRLTSDHPRQVRRLEHHRSDTVR